MSDNVPPQPQAALSNPLPQPDDSSMMSDSVLDPRLVGPTQSLQSGGTQPMGVSSTIHPAGTGGQSVPSSNISKDLLNVSALADATMDPDAEESTQDGDVDVDSTMITQQNLNADASTSATGAKAKAKARRYSLSKVPAAEATQRAVPTRNKKLKAVTLSKKSPVKKFVPEVFTPKPRLSDDYVGTDGRVRDRLSTLRQTFETLKYRFKNMGVVEIQNQDKVAAAVAKSLGTCHGNDCAVTQMISLRDVVSRGRVVEVQLARKYAEGNDLLQALKDIEIDPGHDEVDLCDETVREQYKQYKATDKESKAGTKRKSDAQADPTPKPSGRKRARQTGTLTTTSAGSSSLDVPALKRVGGDVDADTAIGGVGTSASSAGSAAISSAASDSIPSDSLLSALKPGHVITPEELADLLATIPGKEDFGWNLAMALLNRGRRR